MLFNSFSFLIFFPVVVILYFVIPKSMKKIWLLVASYFFYMSWNAKYGLLIAFSTVVTYFCARWIDASSKVAMRRLVLTLCLLSNLGILFFFKYFEWLLGEFCEWFNVSYSLPFDIILPVGISFYTFQALGYTIDVYRKKVSAEKNFITYALFVSFFPQLVAGPIEKSDHLLKQLQEPTSFNRENVVRGLQMMMWGFIEKLVIADTLAIIVDKVYGNYTAYGGAVLLFVTALCAFQIYCDFGGYSHIAIGAARVLGIELMTNFRQPFFSKTIKELWQRWHISLNNWLRDYVYISMGGSRCSKPRRHFNLMVTFLVSGLWHGASWHYVAWGGINGVFQIVGEYVDPLYAKGAKKIHIDPEGLFYQTIQRIVTFFLFVASLIFFRATSMGESFFIFKEIFTNPQIAQLVNPSSWGIENLQLGQIIWLVIAMIALLVVDVVHEKNMHFHDILKTKTSKTRLALYATTVMFLIFSVVQTFGRSASAFLYFQF